MKKVFLVLLSASFMIACGKGKTAKQIAEEVCECSKKANDLPTSDPTRSQAQKDCAAKQVEAWNKVKDNQEKADEFNKILSVCASEQIKKSFGQ
ncbi:MAG: hypothetical protein SGI96_03830 [Bacteroidota bacterium]|nr:hypothetical protein [Bacteroidota bacterium]